ncbi:MAG: hypothetical protein ACI915_004597 [Gammaproteobacteria bacterium]|jgi:hypothetical protein
MHQVLLDPTAELDPAEREPLPKLKSLEGLTIGLLDISKSRGDIFLDRIDSLMQQRGLKTLRFKKPTFTRAAPTELLQQMAQQCDVVVEGLAD